MPTRQCMAQLLVLGAIMLLVHAVLFMVYFGPAHLLPVESTSGRFPHGRSSRVEPSKCNHGFCISEDTATIWIPKPMRKLALVLPFQLKNLEEHAEKINRYWKTPACVAPNPHLDIVLLFNRDFTALPEEASSRVYTVFDLVLQPFRPCFASMKIISSNLTDDEDGYPHGISAQWYKLFLRSYEGFTRVYDYVFWMEHDSLPIRPLWMDRMYSEILTPDEFYVKGSAFRGMVALNNAVKDPEQRPWVPHINGNAFYRLNNPDFISIINITDEKFPVAGNWNPFDTSLWLVLNDIEDHFALWQNYAHKIHYTDYIQNLGMDYSYDHLQRILKESPGTFLIHGDPGGNSTGTRLILELQESGALHNSKERNIVRNAFLQPGNGVDYIPKYATRVSTLVYLSTPHSGSEVLLAYLKDLAASWYVESFHLSSEAEMSEWLALTRAQRDQKKIITGTKVLHPETSVVAHVHPLRPVAYFTMFRHPASWFLAAYKAAKRSTQSNETFAEFIANIPPSPQLSHVFPGFNRAFGVPLTQMKMPALRQGILDQYTAVGIFERFSESLQMFSRLFGWGLPLHFELEATSVPQLTAEEQVILRRDHADDLFLYRVATKVFEEQWMLYSQAVDNTSKALFLPNAALTFPWIAEYANSPVLYVHTKEATSAQDDPLHRILQNELQVKVTRVAEDQLWREESLRQKGEATYVVVNEKVPQRWQHPFSEPIAQIALVADPIDWNCARYSLLAARQPLEELKTFEQYMASQRANPQTTSLGLAEAVLYSVSHDDLRRQIKAALLSRFAVVGLADDLSTTVQVLNRVFGWGGGVPVADRHDRILEYSSSFAYSAEVTLICKSRESLALVRAKHHLDFLLYEVARSIFAQEHAEIVA